MSRGLAGRRRGSEGLFDRWRTIGLINAIVTAPLPSQIYGGICVLQSVVAGCHHPGEP